MGKLESEFEFITHSIVCESLGVPEIKSEAITYSVAGLNPVDASDARLKAIVKGIHAFAKKYGVGPIEQHQIGHANAQHPSTDASGNITMLQKMLGTTSYEQAEGISPEANAVAKKYASRNFQQSDRWITLNHFDWEKLLKGEGFIKEEGAKNEEKGEKWSADVHTKLDTPAGLFTKSAAKIAKYLLQHGKKKAMSRLNFYINRAGSNLSKERAAELEKAKEIISAANESVVTEAKDAPVVSADGDMVSVSVPNSFVAHMEKPKKTLGTHNNIQVGIEWDASKPLSVGISNESMLTADVKLVVGHGKGEVKVRNPKMATSVAEAIRQALAAGG